METTTAEKGKYLLVERKYKYVQAEEILKVLTKIISATTAKTAPLKDWHWRHASA